MVVDLLFGQLASTAIAKLYVIPMRISFCAEGLIDMSEF
jgi:hypothetical protein